MNDCNEIIMDDIIQADFYPADTIVQHTPFGVPGITKTSAYQMIAGNKVDLAADKGEPILSIGSSGEEFDALMERPSHKIQQKREAVGEIYLHTLQIPITMGFDSLAKAVRDINGQEVFVVLTSYSGEKLTVCCFPNTTHLSYEEARGEEHTVSLKYEGESFSGFVSVER